MPRRPLLGGACLFPLFAPSLLRFRPEESSAPPSPITGLPCDGGAAASDGLCCREGPGSPRRVSKGNGSLFTLTTPFACGRGGKGGGRRRIGRDANWRRWIGIGGTGGISGC